MTGNNVIDTTGLYTQIGMKLSVVVMFTHNACEERLIAEIDVASIEQRLILKRHNLGITA